MRNKRCLCKNEPGMKTRQMPELEATSVRNNDFVNGEFGTVDLEYGKTNMNELIGGTWMQQYLLLHQHFVHNMDRLARKKVVKRLLVLLHWIFFNLDLSYADGVRLNPHNLIRKELSKQQEKGLRSVICKAGQSPSFEWGHLDQGRSQKMPVH